MNIDCDECRRRVGSEPKNRDADTDRHLAECPACMRFYCDTCGLDTLLTRALQAESDAVPTQRRGGTGSITRLVAVAAGLAVLIASAALLRLAPLQDGLPARIAAHLAEEPAALHKSPGAASLDDVRRILAGAQLQLRPDHPAVINYIMRCEFNGQHIVHMVIQDTSGPVTVLVMTEDHAVRRAVHFHIDGYRGLVEPAPRGAIAVLSNSGDIDAITRRIMHALVFQIT